MLKKNLSSETNILLIKEILKAFVLIVKNSLITSYMKKYNLY